MVYIQNNNPFKSRKDLRAAKKEAKNYPQESLTDSDLLGAMSGPSVREARKERRQLKKNLLEKVLISPLRQKVALAL